MENNWLDFFETEDEAITYCREVNRGLSSKDPRCFAVVDGPEDNFAVVDLETARELLDPEDDDTALPCLIVTD
jgi:hypothetical protein